MRKCLFIGLGCLLLVSCEKEYTCACTYYSNTQSSIGALSNTISPYYKKKDRSKAEEACRAASFEPNMVGGNGRRCELK